MAVLILARRRPEVKATRRTPRSAARFGAGLLPTHPVYAAPASFADMEWWARYSNGGDVESFDYWETVSAELGHPGLEGGAR